MLKLEGLLYRIPSKALCPEAWGADAPFALPLWAMLPREKSSTSPPPPLRLSFLRPSPPHKSEEREGQENLGTGLKIFPQFKERVRSYPLYFFFYI